MGDEVRLRGAYADVYSRRYVIARQVHADMLAYQERRRDSSDCPRGGGTREQLTTLTRTVLDQREVEDTIIDIDATRALYYVHTELQLQLAEGERDDTALVKRKFRAWLAYFHPQPRLCESGGAKQGGGGGGGGDDNGGKAPLHSSPPTSVPAVRLRARRDDRLRRDEHVAFLRHVLDGQRPLPPPFLALHASQTWICYWIAHSLDVLGEQLTPAEARGIIRLCRASQSPQGGFGGGPGHLPHAAATYAAVMALCIAGTVDCEAYVVVDRRALAEWIRCELKQEAAPTSPAGDGAFRVTADGECDARALYCVLATASLLRVLDADMARGCVEFVRSLRSFDGAFGGEPGNEAHGGYAYCAVASLRILLEHGLMSEAEFEREARPVRRWVAQRQMRFEGGFQGRANKLVDGCYSFWQGALAELCGAEYDHRALSLYIRRYCQPTRYGGGGGGGLCDKPGVPPDFYHTCYALSGLALASWHGRGEQDGDEQDGDDRDDDDHGDGLRRIDPTYNIVCDTLAAARRQWRHSAATVATASSAMSISTGASPRRP